MGIEKKCVYRPIFLFYCFFMKWSEWNKNTQGNFFFYNFLSISFKYCISINDCNAIICNFLWVYHDTTNGFFLYTFNKYEMKHKEVYILLQHKMDCVWKKMLNAWHKVVTYAGILFSRLSTNKTKSKRFFGVPPSLIFAFNSLSTSDLNFINIFW